MNSPEKINLLDFDLEELTTFFAAKGEKAFRAVQVLKWIHQRDAQSFDEMTDLSKTLREDLNVHARIEAPEIVLDQTSIDGTRKWLLKVRDDKEKLKSANGNNIIEMVFIPEDDRGTLCVSSQVGCSLDCSFCSTARQGFNRNLSTSEIIGQVWLANRLLGRTEKFRPITNVVLMGMGEPLHNFKSVVKALNLMMDDNSYGLSKRRVTLSTSGVVPAIDRLREVSEVSLAVSLHAPNDELRDKLVPLNMKHPIAELLSACRRYVSDQHKRQITFEYVMLDGVNDQPEHARQLVKILRGIPGKVNLIPFNPFPNSGYQRSPIEVINKFRDIVQAGGLVTVTRKTRGEDIDAACGQLVGKVNDLSHRYLKFEKPRYGTAASQ